MQLSVAFVVGDESVVTFMSFLGIGNPRGNENPFLLTFGIFWYRYHNALANRIQKLLWAAYKDDGVTKKGIESTTLDEAEFNKHYDEIIFNEARKWVIATHQVCSFLLFCV